MKYSKAIVALLVVTVFSSAMMPNVVFAETTATYKPRTQAETIAYLYGRIAQLMEIKAMVDRGSTIDQAVAATTVDYITVQTHKAVEVEDDRAVLRGEVNLFGDTTARAWFEYGVDEDFLDQRTYRDTVYGVYDRAVRYRITGLEDDTRYYFRIVAEDKNGLVKYGKIYGFRTDESD